MGKNVKHSGGVKLAKQLFPSASVIDAGYAVSMCVRMRMDCIDAERVRRYMRTPTLGNWSKLTRLIIHPSQYLVGRPFVNSSKPLPPPQLAAELTRLLMGG